MEETKRKLASIQKILKLEPIEGADAIEKATVLGWSVVVKKGEFKVGDWVVYFEVDSLLPNIPEFEFLTRGNSLKKIDINGKTIEGIRLKTVRLRGQISQGICFPLSIISTIVGAHNIVPQEGSDVTGLLGVHKYEPPIPFILSGQARGVFPSILPKTDETRLQTVPEILQRYKDVSFYVTEKVDGTSMTVFVKDGEMHVCSRNMDLAELDNTYWRVANALNLKEKLQSYSGRYAIQGELVGEGIQGNKLKIKGQKLLVFNVYDFVEAKYLDFSELQTFCSVNMLEMVPIVDISTILYESVDKMVAYATRKSIIATNTWVEGLVFRPVKEMRDEDLGRLSFKVINPEFLLEYKE